MHLRGRRTGWVAAILLAGFGIAAQGQVDTSAWPQVRAEVLVLNPQGEPWAGLGKDALEIREGKKAHGLIDLQPAAEPQSVCVLIDASGSMYERLSLVLTKARRLMKSLPAEDEVCVADFSTELMLDQTFTGDRRAAEGSLAKIKSSGPTSLRDSVLALAEYMRGSARHRSRAIILFSDGSDNSSKTNWTKLRQAMETAGSPVVHMVCLPPAMGNARAKQVDPQEGSALKLTRTSGGLTYFPHNMSDINSVVDNLAQVLGSRYVLTFEAEDATRDGQEQAMLVEFDKAHRGGRAEVLAPKGYYAPSR